MESERRGEKWWCTVLSWGTGIRRRKFKFWVEKLLDVLGTHLSRPHTTPFPRVYGIRDLYVQSLNYTQAYIHICTTLYRTDIQRCTAISSTFQVQRSVNQKLPRASRKHPGGNPLWPRDPGPTAGDDARHASFRDLFTCARACVQVQVEFYPSASSHLLCRCSVTTHSRKVISRASPFVGIDHVNPMQRCRGAAAEQ